VKDVSGSCAENPAYGRPHIDCPGRGAIATLCQCDCHSETRNDNYWKGEEVESDS
jgi:hypothetical protein